MIANLSDAMAEIGRMASTEQQLRERIADLEAQVERLRASRDEFWCQRVSAIAHTKSLRWMMRAAAECLEEYAEHTRDSTLLREAEDRMRYLEAEIERLRGWINNQCSCLAPGHVCGSCAFLQDRRGGDE